MSAVKITISTSPSNRKEIAEAFGNNQSAVRRIESLTKDVTVNLPDAIDGSATVAQQALELAQALQQVAFVIASASAEVPNADVLTAGAGISITLGSGTITVALTVPVSITDGGTGANSASAALANLGGVPMSIVGQPDGIATLDSGGLVPMAELPPLVDSLTAGSGLSVSSSTGDVTVSLDVPVSIADGGTGETSAGAALTALGGLAAANDLSDVASAPSARMNLGLGTIATQAANAIDIIGGTIDGTDVGDTTPGKGAFTQVTNGDTVLLRTSAALANGAGTAAGTLANAPVAGNPTKWVEINDNGTTRYIPAW